ncbi:hypothetical protein HMPREF3090_03545 [Aerococcus sp. HMSC23C02]|uniref:Uncharacterized protein n=1 Tax=Aerococcus sanguinicola TaxID=119206 RepID=A0A0X8F9I8_9LACT|nr:hypothetical protein AWM72_00065 [Aerococcus sanguinicola]OFT95907.1 hypothetical protein HMPREF3090_03545 [Aerococcus sp. HMSC23C02]
MSIYESQLHDTWERSTETGEYEHIPICSDRKGKTFYIEPIVSNKCEYCRGRKGLIGFISSYELVN